MTRPLIRRAARGIAPLAATLLLGLPGAALASGTPTTTTPTTTTPTTTTPSTTPSVIAAKAKPALYLGGLFSVNKAPVTVPGRAVTVTGIVRPYVAGQQVLLQAFVDGHLFKSVKLALKPSKHKVYGGFDFPVSAPSAGAVSVVVKHSVTPALSAFTVKDGYSTLSEAVGPGSDGRFVQLVQERLQALHLYIPQTGVFDQGTELALDAYHRLLGWGEGDETLGPATVNDLLNGVGTFHIRFPGQGMHAEGDLSDQVLALADGSNVQLLFPISSGKPSTPTVLGSWQVYSRVPGYLPDGMYYSDFFIRGYAIHGYDPAPDYPASHGCMRLPIVDAITAFNWLAIGDWVDSYYT